MILFILYIYTIAYTVEVQYIVLVVRTVSEYSQHHNIAVMSESVLSKKKMHENRD